MRINKFIAQATGLSRRSADQAISEGRVTVNQQSVKTGTDVNDTDTVVLDNQIIKLPDTMTTIMLNKPVGYVCSRAAQGSRTIYELLPTNLHHLKPVGRLDKDSSGLLLLTDDGDLANRLTHPRYTKEKVYEIELDEPLKPEDKIHMEKGVKLDDGPSKLQITDIKDRSFTVAMSEGRNRQIRRTFEALGYEVKILHRINFGDYSLGGLPPGKTQSV